MATFGEREVEGWMWWDLVKECMGETGSSEPVANFAVEMHAAKGKI